MNQRLSVVFLVFLFTSCYYADSDCSSYFTDFSEMRINVYLDQQSLDSSYLERENWTSFYTTLSGIQTEVELDIYPEDPWVFAIHFPQSYHLYVEDSVFLDFGNGDVDTILFTQLSISSFECGDLSWIDKAWINGDSLSRDTDKSFLYGKE